MTVLELGTKGRILAREEEITIGAEAAEPWRLLYASDLHLTHRRSHLIDRLTEAADRAKPDVILLGGDLVDDSSGFTSLTDCVRALRMIAKVAAVPGTHDVLFGKSRVRRAVEEGGGLWLADPDLRLSGGGKKDLWLHGRPRPTHDPARRRVLVAHHPDVFRHAAELGYDLVLAGHLHGGQCVFWERDGRFYPGAFFLPWNGRRFTLGKTTMLVSRGVADTIPLRFQCPREVVVCNVARSLGAAFAPFVLSGESVHEHAVNFAKRDDFMRDFPIAFVYHPRRSFAFFTNVIAEPNVSAARPDFPMRETPAPVRNGTGGSSIVDIH